MSKLKKTISAFLFFLILFTSIATPLLVSKVSAQAPNPWYNQDLVEFEDKVFDENSNEVFGERYTYAQINWIMYSIMELLLQGKVGDVIQALESGEGEEAHRILREQTPLGQITNLTTSVINTVYSNLPASGVFYLATTLHNFSPVKDANAQFAAGAGFEAVSLVLNLWRAVRNFTYLLFVLAAIVISFMIMFRSKINPQTIVSLQSSLPKIVITLIYVTFSYAIAGLLIDFMYLFFALFVFGISAFGGLSPSASAASVYFSDFVTSDLNTVFDYLSKAPGALISISPGISGTVTAITVGVLFAIKKFGGGPALAAALGSILLAVILAVLGYILSVIIMLSQSLLSLLVNIIFAPVIILYQSFLPTQNTWLRSIISDVLVFLSVGLLLTFADILNFAINDFGGDLWSPPYLGADKAMINGMVVLGVLSLLPGLRGMIYQALKRQVPQIGVPPQFSQIGKSVQEGIGTAVSAIVKSSTP